MATISAALTCLAGQPTKAGEQLLEFRLVVRPLDVKGFEAPDVDGQVVSLMKMHGVAFFKDGRVASKDFIFNTDFNKGSGPGAFAGAKGSGAFDSVAHKLSSANLFNGRFTVATP